jgi:hypothetical protein
MNLNSNGRIKGAILLGLAFLLWMFGPKVPLDRYYPAKQQVEPQSAERAVDSYSTRALAGNLEDLTTPPPKEVDRSTTKVIRECLPELDPSFTSQSFSLKDLADHLKDSRSASTKIEVQNFHLITADGREMRMMIAPSDSTEFDGLEAQLFTVDSEGLPVIEELPLSLQPRDIDAAKKHFFNLGTLTFSETTYLYKDDATKIAGKLNYSFDELTGAELSQNGRFLGCSKAISSKSIVCKCL